MQLSRFNVQSNWQQDAIGVFNTYTLNFVALDRREHSALIAGQDETGELARLGFLVHDRVAEIGEALSEFRASKTIGRTHLSVTVAPTLACNFSCGYCSNGLGHRRGDVGKVVSTAIDYIDRELRQGELLELTWFGGEPLLVLGEIESATKDIQLLAGRRRGEVSVSVVTNGFLADARVLQRLSAIGTSHVQFSFDLPLRSSQRFTRAAGADEILQRVVASIDAAATDIHFTFRFNCLKGFSADIPLVAGMLSQARHRKLSAYLHHVFASPAIDGPVTFGSPADVEHYYAEYRVSRELLRNKGLLAPKLPDLSSSACPASRTEGPVYISSEGIRTCIRELSGTGGELVDGVPNDVTRWYREFSGLGGPECTKCPYLPVCGGGCPKDVRSGLQIPFRCTPWRFTLVDELDDLLRRHLEGRSHNGSNSGTKH